MEQILIWIILTTLSDKLMGRNVNFYILSYTFSFKRLPNFSYNHCRCCLFVRLIIVFIYFQWCQLAKVTSFRNEKVHLVKCKSEMDSCFAKRVNVNTLVLDPHHMIIFYILICQLCYYLLLSHIDWILHCYAMRKRPWADDVLATIISNIGFLTEFNSIPNFLSML